MDIFKIADQEASLSNDEIAKLLEQALADWEARKGAVKNALRHFAKCLGFGLENCMAFGDGMNDFTMVEAAGLGIAMANAEPEVKRVAKDVVPSNDEDGVAKGIDKWIFSR